MATQDLSVGQGATEPNESEVIELGNYYEVGNGRGVFLRRRQHLINRYGKSYQTSPSLRTWRG